MSPPSIDSLQTALFLFISLHRASSFDPLINSLRTLRVAPPRPFTCSTLPSTMKPRTDQKHGTKFEMAHTTQTQPEMETKRVENKSQAAAQAVVSSWREYVNAFLAAEISALTRYYDRVIQWLPREDDKGALLAAVAAPRKETIGKDEPFPDLTHERDKRTAILINGTFNYDFDIQALLIHLKTKLSRTSRLVVLLYNPYLRWAYYLATRLESARASCRAPS